MGKNYNQLILGIIIGIIIGVVIFLLINKSPSLAQAPVYNACRSSFVTMDLNSDYNTVDNVIYKNSEYAVELISASDSAATIKVIRSDYSSETKEISEGDTKIVGGLTITVTDADETNFKLTAILETSACG